MGNAARKLRKNGDLVELQRALQEKSTDDAFRLDFENLSVKSHKMGFYILRRMEIVLSANAGQLIPFAQSPNQHLEHIMPKKPEQKLGWQHVMNGEEKADDYDNYLYRVGNFLVLEADINKSIKNKSFADKKVRYAESKLVFPKEAQVYEEESSWTYTSITERQKKLAEYALKTWTLNCVTG